MCVHWSYVLQLSYMEPQRNIFKGKVIQRQQPKTCTESVGLPHRYNIKPYHIPVISDLSNQVPGTL